MGFVENVRRFVVASSILAFISLAGFAIDAHSTVYANGSIYLPNTNNTSTDYAVSSADSTNFSMGTGDFTIEAWVYSTGFNSAVKNWTSILSVGLSQTVTPSTNGHELRISQSNGNDGYLGILYPASSSTDATSSSGVALPLNTWVHLAMVRSGSNLYLYKNGTAVITVNSVSFNQQGNGSAGAGSVFFGKNGNWPDNFFQGYISNYRVVKGCAVYTGNFTVPSGPLTTASCGTTVFLANTTYDTNYKKEQYTGTNLTLAGSAASSVQNPFGTQPVPVTLSNTGSVYQFQHSNDIVLTATLQGSDGLVTFYYNGKKIFKCSNIQSSNLIATCNWRPTIHGTTILNAYANPSITADFTPNTSNKVQMMIGSRSVAKG
jgi:hypothetical protein